MVNKKGFLLLEVMISIVIITAGVLFITRSYSLSKESIERSTGLLMTSLLLENRIWEFEEKGEIEEGRQSGDFAENSKYSWHLNAQPVMVMSEEETEEEPALNLVQLDVFQEKDPLKTKYSIWTYLRNKQE